MNNVLIVVDMQNDFIDGALGTPEAQEILPRVKKFVRDFDGRVIFTRDTHTDDYMNTREGRYLPVPHCIKGTHGWQIHDSLKEFVKEAPIDKPTFGSTVLSEKLVRENEQRHIDRVTLIGLCTDICVISNAMLIKASLPETDVAVIKNLCAGVTKNSHERALDAMAMCQIITDIEEK